MKKIFINYADGPKRFLEKQQESIKLFRQFGEFDEYIGYTRQIIDSDFYTKNKQTNIIRMNLKSSWTWIVVR